MLHNADGVNHEAERNARHGGKPDLGHGYCPFFGKSCVRAAANLHTFDLSEGCIDDGLGLTIRLNGDNMRMAIEW